MLRFLLTLLIGCFAACGLGTTSSSSLSVVPVDGDTAPKRMESIVGITEQVWLVGDSDKCVWLTETGGRSWTTSVCGKSTLTPLSSHASTLAVGVDGNLRVSDDSGITWIDRGRLPESTNSLSMSGTNGWAIADLPNGKSCLFRTEDGGATWTRLATRAFPNLNQILFLDTKSGFAVGNGAYRTFDGGATWERFAAGRFLRIDFDDDALGWLVENEINATRVTTDGGHTWRIVADLPAIQNNAQLYLSDHGKNGHVIDSDGTLWRLRNTTWVLEPPIDAAWKISVGRGDAGEPAIAKLGSTQLLLVWHTDKGFFHAVVPVSASK